MMIYLAAPLFTIEERLFNENLRQELREYDINLMLPQDNPDHSVAAYVASADLAMLDQCDHVLAICEGAEVDSGTAFEIGYSYAKGKDVLLYRTDTRPYFNKMIHGTYHTIARSIDDVIHYYRKLMGK